MYQHLKQYGYTIITTITITTTTTSTTTTSNTWTYYTFLRTGIEQYFMTLHTQHREQTKWQQRDSVTPQVTPLSGVALVDSLRWDSRIYTNI